MNTTPLSNYEKHLNINELEKITQIASILCQTSTSAINIIYKDDVINLTGTGLLRGDSAINDSFCQYTVKVKGKVFVVENANKDQRFATNKYVLGSPLAFYAGAPIISSNGEVLGALCVQDEKPNKLTPGQEEALLNLASLATLQMDQQEILKDQLQKIYEADERLKLVADNAPGVLFQFNVNPDRKYHVPFISKGIISLLPWIDPEDLYKNPDLLFNIIHSGDKSKVEKQIGYAYQNAVAWDTEYRLTNPEGEIKWVSSKAKPHVSESGKVTWFGTLQDVTVKREYIANLENLIADISHVLRRPITSMQGLINILTNDNLNQEEALEILQLIDTTFKEFDNFTRELSRNYDEQRKAFKQFLGSLPD